MNCSGEEKFNAGVVLTDSGAIKNPMNVDVILIAINIACSLVGIPLNCFTGLVILHLRRLRSKPRNIFLLGIVASNLSAFIPPIIETVHFFRPGDEVACKSYLAVVGLPEVFLLLNMLISLLDRYTALRKPMWHRLKISATGVAFGLVIAFVSAVLVGKFVFIAGLIPLRCEIRLIERKVISWTMAILFTSCLAARISVYLQTRRVVQNHRNLQENCQTASSSSSHQSAQIRLGSKVSSRRSKWVHQMELDATKTLAMEVTSLFILSCPMIVFLTVTSACRSWYSPVICNRFSWIAPYFRLLSQIHAIYHPIMYFKWNPEFSTVLEKRCVFIQFQAT